MGIEEGSGASGFSLKTWMRLGVYFKGMRKDIASALTVIILATLGEAAYPLFIRHAVNSFVVPETSDGIVPFAAAYVGVVILVGILIYFWVKLLIVVEMNMSRMIRRDCFVHLQKLPLSYHNVNSVGYLIGRVMSDTERISGMISFGLSGLMESVFHVVFSIVFMLFLSPALASIIILVVFGAAIIAWIFQKKILAIGRQVRETNSQISGAYNEGITGSKTSKTLVIEDINSEEFSKLSDRMHLESVRSSRLSALMSPIIMSLGSLALSIILYRGGVLVGSQLLDFGILSAFIAYASSVIGPIVRVSGTMAEMVNAQVGIERIMGLLDQPITISDAAQVTEKYGDTFAPKRENWEPIAGRVTFERVWFKYPDGEDNVLEDFSLDVPSGTTVAIVGETGAGKSTIVNLACRFYEPTEGRVLIDGIDCRERSQLWLHSSLGYVLQDPHLFSGTILENIRYGRLDATDEEVIEAAKLVSADIIAQRLPEGFDTDVGEGGDKLSTGEKQLVSFARAILANPPIFVLDEATSSIDTETELLIQSAISHILEGRTSFIIAHRLSTIVRSDLILVVEDGKIVERGTHAQLLAAEGKYSALYKAMRLDELQKK